MGAIRSCAARRVRNCLKALDVRMDDNIKNEGAIVFSQVFDEVAIEMARQ